MTNRGTDLSRLQSEVLRRQLPTGGWAALASATQPALEPTCYSVLALAAQQEPSIAKTQDFLLRAQNSNGSWPVFPGDDDDGSWLTSLVVIALRDRVPAIPARLKGLEWLLHTSGRESNWLWKWKFRTADRHVCFDPDKYGWPWTPGTVSWVVPTSFAILALQQLPSCTCGGFEQVPARIDCGVQMLLDRACPAGGWNAGNGVVYGEPVAPHADDTAVALLALWDRPHDPVVQPAVKYLEGIAANLSAPWSLAWTILALAAHHRPVEGLRSTLSFLPDLINTEDNGTLAMACLALEPQRSFAAFGVTA